MRHLRLLTAITALAAIGGCAQATAAQPAPPSFWSQLHTGGGTGEYLFDSLDDITPGAKPSGVFRPAAALVEGTVVGVEPGIAYASGDDSATARIVPYDSEEAAIRWASVVIKVDKVHAGKLGRGFASGQIRLRVEQPTGTTLDGLRASLGTAGRGIFYVDSALNRAGRRPASQAAQAYQAAVHLPIGQGVFVEEKPGTPLLAPLTDEERAAQLLGGGAQTRSAGAGATTLAQLRVRAQQSACEAGTATDKSTC
ncbi:hypothetical protein ABZ897_19335 [Nonomuraea sp. NPDC046802]|uniref:hypothetical protein n=1 Tax=Nonomuraea sp. NPDC046802 TaxID=3154919 RepID=UPI0033E145D9